MENPLQFVLTIKTGVICTVLALTMGACDKSDEPSKEEINVKLLAGSQSKTWRIVSSKINGTESLFECVKDDDWTFERTNHVTRQNVTISCTKGLSDYQASSWSFANNGNWLTFFGGTYEVVSLTENEMILKFPQTGMTYVDTYVKK